MKKQLTMTLNLTEELLSEIKLFSSVPTSFPLYAQFNANGKYAIQDEIIWHLSSSNFKQTRISIV